MLQLSGRVSHCTSLYVILHYWRCLGLWFWAALLPHKILWNACLNSGLNIVYIIGLSVELKYPIHKKKAITCWLNSKSFNPSNSLKIGIINAKIKNGNQHAMKAPVTIAKVLAAFRSRFASSETCFFSLAIIDCPRLLLSTSTSPVSFSTSRSLRSDLLRRLSSRLLDIALVSKLRGIRLRIVGVGVTLWSIVRRLKLTWRFGLASVWQAWFWNTLICSVLLDEISEQPKGYFEIWSGPLKDFVDLSNSFVLTFYKLTEEERLFIVVLLMFVLSIDIFSFVILTSSWSV